MGDRGQFRNKGTDYLIKGLTSGCETAREKITEACEHNNSHHARVQNFLFCFYRKTFLVSILVQNRSILRYFGFLEFFIRVMYFMGIPGFLL